MWCVLSEDCRGFFDGVAEYLHILPRSVLNAGTFL